ncbi:MAG: F-type conjugal transfer pilus assembly protein TraB [Yersiniaceae bacterium]|nr:F-type conjugal transfer pilus assembly protein TraB [Yersiniaceae bacterium]
MNINTQVKRKQIALFIACVLGISAVASGAWYVANRDKRAAEAEKKTAEPAPDLTGVIDRSFDNKAQQNAIIQGQMSQNEMKKDFEELKKELQMLNKSRMDDQKRLGDLERENAQLREKQNAQANTPVAPPAGAAPTGEPRPNTVNVPPPTQFYPGAGTPAATQVSYNTMPAMQAQSGMDTTTFSYEAPVKNAFPYIPSGSFAKAMVIEGADANAAVTGPQNTAPMQFRLTGRVQMPNDKVYDLTGCFVNAEAYGDVSSERAEVRTRSISCNIGDDVIDQKIAGHVSFMGKNGIKGQVVMRNGKILGWAFGAGVLDGIGQGMQSVGSTAVGIGATAEVSGGDVARSGLGGGASQAAKTLSEYYIKRAEQYHPIIPIGAGNEVTVVFQDGFQLMTLAEQSAAKRKTKSAAQEAGMSAAEIKREAVKQVDQLNLGDVVPTMPPMAQN